MNADRSPRTDRIRWVAAAVLLAGVVASGPPAAAQVTSPPKKDWHVDLGLTLGLIGSFNNAFPFQLGIRAVGSWKWIGGEFRMAVLPLTIHDEYSGGGEHDTSGSPFVSFGEGLRVIAVPDYWVTPYVVLLAQQVVNTLSGHPIHALGPILGVQFQWPKSRCGFFLEGGTTFVLDAVNGDLGGRQRDASVPYLWQGSVGLNVRF